LANEMTHIAAPSMKKQKLSHKSRVDTSARGVVACTAKRKTHDHSSFMKQLLKAERFLSLSLYLSLSLTHTHTHTHTAFSFQLVTKYKALSNWRGVLNEVAHNNHQSRGMPRHEA